MTVIVSQASDGFRVFCAKKAKIFYSSADLIRNLRRRKGKTITEKTYLFLLETVLDADFADFEYRTRRRLRPPLGNFACLLLPFTVSALSVSRALSPTLTGERAGRSERARQGRLAFTVAQRRRCRRSSTLVKSQHRKRRSGSRSPRFARSLAGQSARESERNGESAERFGQIGRRRRRRIGQQLV